ncbi:MAG: Clp protease N-terminal domain-containing protein, partial [Planctomycetota bacterium]
MAFRFDKLTIKAQEAVQRAQELAADAGNPQIEPMHLLGALLQEDDGVVRPVLDHMGVNVTQLQAVVHAELGHLPKSSGGAPPQPSPELRKLLEAAQKSAEGMQDEFVSTGHLLLAATQTASKAQDSLKLNGIAESDVLSAMKEIRGSARVTDQTPEDKFQALDKYGIDLVARAEDGKLDPVIGR